MLFVHHRRERARALIREERTSARWRRAQTKSSTVFLGAFGDATIVPRHLFAVRDVLRGEHTEGKLATLCERHRLTIRFARVRKPRRKAAFVHRFDEADVPPTIIVRRTLQRDVEERGKLHAGVTLFYGVLPLVPLPRRINFTDVVIHERTRLQAVGIYAYHTRTFGMDSKSLAPSARIMGFDDFFCMILRLDFSRSRRRVCLLLFRRRRPGVVVVALRNNSQQRARSHRRVFLTILYRIIEHALRHTRRIPAISAERVQLR